jgi:hypothetical protein
MPLFRQHHEASAPGRPGTGGGLPEPGPAAFAAARGWAPAGDRPFDGHLEDAAAEINRTLHGAARSLGTMRRAGLRIGATTFRDAYRGSVDGRVVIVANAWTNIGPEVRQSAGEWYGAAVCAVELPSLLPLLCVQPRRFPPVTQIRESPAGAAPFDDRFLVAGTPGPVSAAQLLTPAVQQRVMAHDDWVFWAERYLLGCVSQGPFRDAGQVARRVDEVLAIVAAIPASVLPDHVDHSADDLIARAGRLTSMQEGLVFLQQLTPAERDRLARSDSPLAALADVRTPQEAMARLKALDPQRKMQVMAMFMRVRDSQRRH